MTKMKGNSQQISLRGIVIPVDWDEKGNIMRVAVMTADEGEYFVEENEQSKHLDALMRQEVEVIGMVREEIGRKVITVENWKSFKRTGMQ